MTNVATSTALINTFALSLFNGLGGLLTTVIPFAIAILIFYIGWRWLRRAIAGR